jgi:hypothetical protein
LDNDQQKPLAIFADNQMALARLMGIKTLPMVGTNEERNQDAPLQGGEAYMVQAVKAHNALIVGHGGVLAKSWTECLVSPIGASHPRQAANYHLRGKIKPCAQLMIVQPLQGQFVRTLLGKSPFSQPVTRIVKARHGGTQGNGLVFSGQQFKLQGQFHPQYISGYFPNVKGFMAPSAAEGIAPVRGNLSFLPVLNGGASRKEHW